MTLAGLCSGRQGGEVVDLGEDLVVDAHGRAEHRAAVHDPVPDGDERLRRGPARARRTGAGIAASAAAMVGHRRR